MIHLHNKETRQNFSFQILQQKWYILVDEYQDTNAAQYMLLRLLSSERKIFAV